MAVAAYQVFCFISHANIAYNDRKHLHNTIAYSTCSARPTWQACGCAEFLWCSLPSSLFLFLYGVVPHPAAPECNWSATTLPVLICEIRDAHRANIVSVPEVQRHLVPPGCDPCSVLQSLLRPLHFFSLKEDNTTKLCHLSRSEIRFWVLREGARRERQNLVSE